jgi:NADH dehydrogenase FAD-containing subunit
MYIPAFGLVPNSSFLPAQYLDAQGFISVDTHLRLAQHANVWALGDVCATEGMQFLTCDRQSVYVAKCVGAEVSGKKLKVGYKPLGSRKYLELRERGGKLMCDDRYDGITDWAECWDRTFWELEVA